MFVSVCLCVCGDMQQSVGGDLNEMSIKFKLRWEGRSLPAIIQFYLVACSSLTHLSLSSLFLSFMSLTTLFPLTRIAHTHTRTRARTDAVKELQLIRAESLACLSLNIIAVASEASL